ncbi:MAG: hypothetical protein SFV23_17065, partial [Planctomycetaceae bacterium]|nr:hypothetical protein [Planctomycetaceae bacterium]
MFKLRLLLATLCTALSLLGMAPEASAQGAPRSIPNQPVIPPAGGLELRGGREAPPAPLRL